MALGGAAPTGNSADDSAATSSASSVHADDTASAASPVGGKEDAEEAAPMEIELIPEPPADEMAKILKDELDKPLKVDDEWMLLSKRWFKELQGYTGLKLYSHMIRSGRPGPIDNSNLIQKVTEDGVIVVKVYEDIEYISARGWALLCHWFGVCPGPQEIRRKVIRPSYPRVEVNLLPLTLSLESAREKTVIKHVSSGLRVKALRKLMCQLFEVPFDTDSTRVWNYYNNTFYEVMGDIYPLEKFSLLNEQRVLLEVKNADGQWPRDLATGNSATIGSYGSSSGGSMNSYNSYDSRSGVGLGAVGGSSNYSSYGNNNNNLSSSNNYGGGGSSSSGYNTSYNSNNYSSSSGYNNNYGGYNNNYSSSSYGYGSSSYDRDNDRYSSSSSSFSAYRSDPGRCGLTNLGNTCFMNSALQCLSNTTVLREFFLSDKYRAEINTVNPIGWKGRLADTFADLMRAMWSGQNSSVNATQLKRTISEFAPQFSGYQQHDAQEFLGFLLDGLHEDLNRVQVKPFKETESSGRDDLEAANEAWEYHKARNNSIIVDLFQGQYRSTLVCPRPECGKITVKFDPFMYLTLPLPERETIQVPVTVHWHNTNRTPTRYGVLLPVSGSGATLKQLLSEATGIPVKDLVLAEVYNHRIFSLKSDTDRSRDFDSKDDFHAYECPSLPDDVEPILLKIHLVRKEGYYSDSFFGMPFALLVPRAITEAEITNLVLPRLRLRSPQRSRAGSSGAATLDPVDAYSMDMSPRQPVGAALAAQDSSGDTPVTGDAQGQPLPFTLIPPKYYNSYSNAPLEYQLKFPDQDSLYDEEANMKIEYDSSCDVVPAKQGVLSIDDCLELFQKEERLTQENAWRCSFCKEEVLASKKMELYRVSDILVVHLKRFFQFGYVREKVTAEVDFPLVNFELTKYVKSPMYKEPLVYDLFAVSNHFGSLAGGHYTANAYNESTKKWYNFDDSYVQECSASDCKSNSSYLLFYKRRQSDADAHASRVKAQADDQMRTTPAPDTDENASAAAAAASSTDGA